MYLQNIYLIPRTCFPFLHNMHDTQDMHILFMHTTQDMHQVFNMQIYCIFHRDINKIKK